MFDGWHSCRRARFSRIALAVVTGLALFGFVVLGTQVAGATTLTVTNCSDSVSAPPAGSLRAEVEAAVSGDTIDFAPSPACNLITVAGAIDITVNLTLEGPETSGMTISGGNANQVFDISNAVTATIDTLTIENGDGADGGGIDNGGSLTVSDSTVSGNTATDSGGGIYNTGTLDVLDSTFSADDATNDGGAIDNNGGSVSVTNSTLDGNTAGSGGGLFGTVSVGATIVASNTGGDCSGTITDLGYNLDDDGSCGFTTGAPDHDLPDTNPEFGSTTPEANGGPTNTLALLVASSPAVDAVTAASLCPSTDQRGNPTSVPCDIGAYDTDQTIVFTSSPPANAAASGPTYTVSAVGGFSGNPVVVTVDATSAKVCSIAGSSVSFIGTGTCTLDANQAGNTENAAAVQVQQSFAVGATAQAITFTSTPPLHAVVGGSIYEVKAFGGGSGNPVVFTSVSKTDCKVSGSAVTFVGAGECIIEANQAGNALFSAAPTTQQSFTIGPAQQAITFRSTPPVLATVGERYKVAASGGASGNPVMFSSGSILVCSVSGSVVTIDGAGTCTIDANQAGNANYSAASQVQQSFYVDRRSQSITFTSKPPTNAKVGGPTYKVTALGGGSANPVEFSIASSAGSVCFITGAVVRFVGAGTCVIDANQAGNSGYSAAAQAEQAVTVAQLPSPAIASFRPASGPVGAKVIIKGANLANAIRVTFNGIGAEISSASNTRIVVFVPAGATTGTITVTTKTASTTSTQSFTVT